MRTIVDGWRRVARRRSSLKEWLGRAQDEFGQLQASIASTAKEEMIRKGGEEGGAYGRAKAYSNHHVKSKVLLALVINAFKTIDPYLGHHSTQGSEVSFVTHQILESSLSAA